MVCEELSLEIQCSTDRFVGFDIALATINDWNVTQSEGNTSWRDGELLEVKNSRIDAHSSCQDVNDVGSLVHKIDLC